MGLFSGLFGTPREEIWKEVATSLGGTYTPRTFLRGDKVQVRTENGIITLDLETESSGEHSTTLTRLRAPFVNRLGHRLKIYRAGFFSEVGKMLGTQDIVTGDPHFDAEFMVQGRSPEWVKAVLDPAARRLIQGHERFFLEIRPENQLFGSRYPESVELLIFKVPEIIKDGDRLRSLFHLLDHLLRRMETVALSHLDPGARPIAILEGPGGQIIEEGEVLWNGTLPRCQAAAELGRLREARAVPALLRAIKDPDPGLCSAAVDALGQIGAPEAIPGLVPLLGTDPQLREWSLAGRAAQALTMLGQKPLVDAFQAGCKGQLKDPSVVIAYRKSFVAALAEALSCDRLEMVRGSAETLCQLGAVEALEAMRQRYRKVNARQADTREVLSRAIDHLESLSRLPRPSSSPGPDAASLPRAASPDTRPDAHELPLPSENARLAGNDLV